MLKAYAANKSNVKAKLMKLFFNRKQISLLMLFYTTNILQ